MRFLLLVNKDLTKTDCKLKFFLYAESSLYRPKLGHLVVKTEKLFLIVRWKGIIAREKVDTKGRSCEPPASRPCGVETSFLTTRSNSLEGPSWSTE